MECNAVKRAPHPPSSPDLAPSDFYLFGHVKPLLRGHELADREALLHTIEDILTGIEKVILEDIFSAGWRDSANTTSAAGEYVE
jgi:hypothetical protein